MKDVKVLGPGCARCKTLAEMVQQSADQAGIAIKLEKIDDMATIVGYGVMSTPGLVIDGKLVHAGGLPDAKKIAGWLQDGPAT
ncbi:thioredoxin family protein [Azoarcus sp. L1K30]|uniref:thioredoxin family protein n=1 Tax=Azoarcus sp. L1K30 TaxID=2820277 RepID=UPI001B8174B8|nr:thioredoxin family protein [Azoarcus sp. L1K30]MBR0568157.1 thioredoxin family protein [Azoarcus sp. L1K30]